MQTSVNGGDRLDKHVIDIVKDDTRKRKVLIDEEPVYYLYLKDIRNLKLVVGMAIEEDTIAKIKEILIKRGANYCFHLIAKKDFTVQEIRQKLVKALYNEECTQAIIAKLIDMKLLDDHSYTKRYLESYLPYKSKKWIEHKLYLKGIKDIDYERTLDSMDMLYNDQKAAIELAIRKWLRQKKNQPHCHPKNANEKPEYLENSIDTQKLIQHLYQKGFDYVLIKDIISRVL